LHLIVVYVRICAAMGKAKSRADIQKAYRERKKLENAEAFREKERQRWHKRRGQKLVKSIEDMNEREKRVMRRKWRQDKSEYRQKLKVSKASTPPSSDEDHRKKRGRATLARNQRKAYRTIRKLSVKLTDQTRYVEKYKKRWLRLRKMHTISKLSSGIDVDENSNRNHESSVSTDVSNASYLDAEPDQTT